MKSEFEFMQVEEGVVKKSSFFSDFTSSVHVNMRIGGRSEGLRDSREKNESVW